jgi:hypothetical protein
MRPFALWLITDSEHERRRRMETIRSSNRNNVANEPLVDSLRYER